MLIVVTFIVVPYDACVASCELKQLASLDAQLGPDGALVVQTYINGEPIPMKIATGTFMSEIFDSAAFRLGLAVTLKEGASILDGDREEPAQEATVQELKLGVLAAKNVKFWVGKLKGLAEPDAAGLLGEDILQNYDIEIDLSDHKVNLFSQKHCSGNVVYWAKQYFMTEFNAGFGPIRLPVELNGISMVATIETQTADNLMRLRTARGRFDFSPDNPGVTPADPIYQLGTNKMTGYHYSLDQLKFGELTIHHPQFYIVNDSKVPGIPCGFLCEDATISIGMQLLQHLRLYIAYGERRLYYTLSEPAKN